MTHMVREEVPRLLTKVDDADGQQLIEDAAIRTDLTAWLDGLLQKSLRQWELLPSKSAYEDSLKVRTTTAVTFTWCTRNI